MKKLLTILFIGAATLYGADLPLSDGDRIVIEGDSVTDAKKWSCYLSDYLILMNPSLNLHIQILARGGTTLEYALDDPTGYHGYDEYNKLVASMQPKYVFVMYGMNGPDTPTQFGVSATDLGDNYIVGKSGAIPIFVGAQPQTTSTGRVINGNYEDQETTLCVARDWPYARLWHALFSSWTNSANWSALQYPGTQSAPATHPGSAGHIIMAKKVIELLSWSTTVSTATINASNNTVTSSDHCAIGIPTGNAYSGVDFTRLDNRLPWSIDEDGRTNALAVDSTVNGWLTYSITVTGLSSGTYNIFCDGVQIGSDLSNTTLSTGWNMADLTSGPVFDQVQEVLGCIRDMLGVDRVTLANSGPPWHGVYKYKSNAAGAYNLGQRGAILLASLQPAITEVNNYDALIHSAAQPVTRHYSIRLSSIPNSTPTVAPTATATCTCPG